MIGDRMLRLAEVKEITSLSRSEIYRRCQAGTFPKQTRISHRCARWRQSEVLNWVERTFAGQ